MARTVAIGIQDFEQIRINNCFYVDKTDFNTAKQRICQLIKNLYSDYSFLSASEKLTGIDKDFIRKIATDMNEADAGSLYERLLE